MKLNLIMASNIQHPLRFSKSNNAGILDIPYDMSNPAPLARYLESYVPNDWNQALLDLHKQERTIVEQRKLLMASYKSLATEIFPPLIAQFKHEHPEHFI